MHTWWAHSKQEKQQQMTKETGIRQFKPLYNDIKHCDHYDDYIMYTCMYVCDMCWIGWSLYIPM